ncbi:serine protease [Brevibacillus ruminantium]|uniref:Serine protease n=1 Tax=Brevibacillus ruminantium TaxID=2950604 RepID=A0ABY4WHZ0_9BACL|nr:NfeD family protein [Brevibacillus ruminantium]USG66770.1 serine protease [Brevibacillus ruminantium]
MGVWDIIYLVCMITGLVYTLFTLFFGDSVSEWMAQTELPVFQPLLLISGLTAFGASGYLFTRFTSFSPWTVFAFAVIVGFVLAVTAYFTWIKPMENAENSIGYTMQQLSGMVGEVLTTVPAEGLGEVIVTMVSGRTNHMAASLEREVIPEGTKVVVVDVRDHVLYVTPFHNSGEKESM